MTYLQHYVQLLLTKFVRPHFAAGVTDVHVIFDTPGALPETPKMIEKSRSDLSTEHEVLTHHCNYIPDKWRTVLNCWTCRKALIQ